MPSYEVKLRVPAGTKKEDPAVATLKVPQGVIVKMEVFFPSGCRGYVHTRCLYGNTPIAPCDPDQDFTGDNYTIVISEFLVLWDKEVTLKFEGWSPDANYDHTVIWRIFVLPVHVALPVRQYSETFSRLQALLDLFEV